MARRGTVFFDPQTGDSYTWPVNHNEEDPIGKSRQMADGAPTSGIGLIPQEGVPTPLVLTWKGEIYTLEHLQNIVLFYTFCDSRSIHVTDPAGSTYEVLITDFTQSRHPTARNDKDPINAPTWYWAYTLTMRVLTVISGEWAGVTP